MNATVWLCMLVCMVLCGFESSAQVYPHCKPQICPQPLSCQLSSVDYVPFGTVNISCPDSEACDWARRHLKEWYGKTSPKVTGSVGNTAGMSEDEYSIEIGGEGIRVEAASLNGVRYALYTLRQIAIAKRGTLKVEGWILPKGQIKDKPLMDFRGIHICWFKETEPWEVERLIRLAAYYKMNYAVIEPWGTYRSKAFPWFAWPDATMTPKEVKRLKKIADDLGITLIPQLNVFGHATQARGGTSKHATLDINPEYQTLFEPLDGWNFCLSNPQTRKVLQDMIIERLEVFGNPPFFHIGCDEAGLPSCPECSSQPYSKLLLDHIKAMNETINAHGARTMMWHDMLLDRKDERWKGFVANGSSETSASLMELPRDIIICDWFYGGAKESYPTLDYFNKNGFSVITCPWLNRNGMIKQNRCAYESGIYGILGTLWHRYFGEDMRMTYFTLANTMWNPTAKVFGRGEDSACVNTHIRQVGWDMGVKDPRHTGIFYDEIPPEPFLNN